jgi:hypothetical protein
MIVHLIAVWLFFLFAHSSLMMLQPSLKSGFCQTFWARQRCRALSGLTKKDNEAQEAQDAKERSLLWASR